MNELDQRSEEALYVLLEALDDALEQDDASRAHRLLAQARELVSNEHPEVAFAEASLAWLEDGAAVAAAKLQRVIELDPTHADAHYALARCAQEQGRDALAVEHHLHVLRLDAREARRGRIATRERLDFIEQVASRVLRDLPEPFAGRMAHVPVVLEARPSLDLVQDGFDPRALGLFEGPTDADSGVAAPTRIVLYTHNLLADFPEREELEHEIEITVLHEIGHFFGLDEADMERLGLD